MVDCPVYALEIEELGFTYPDGTRALAGLTLRIRQGSRVAVLGANGAGKTTLLLHLNGTYLPQEGRVVVMGREVNRASRRWVKGQVGLVFQDPDDQLFAPTVWDDVAFGPANMGLSPEEIRRRVRAALEAVGAAELASRAPHRLSWGQKKRVAIAGVLAMDPGVLVLDEPTAFLDPAGREGLLRVLENLHREGRTLVMATHDVDLAAEWADEVVILAGGKVAAAGAPRILTQEELVERCGLIAPTVTRLFARLRQEGMESGSPPLTMEEAVSRLRAYFSSADRDQRGR